MFTDNVVRSLSCKARANAVQYVILSAIVSYIALPFSLPASLSLLPFYHSCHRATAVSSAYGNRRTMGVTAVVRAADGRRTVRFTVSCMEHDGKIQWLLFRCCHRISPAYLFEAASLDTTALCRNHPATPAYLFQPAAATIQKALQLLLTEVAGHVVCRVFIPRPRY